MKTAIKKRGQKFVDDPVMEYIKSTTAASLVAGLFPPPPRPIHRPAFEIERAAPFALKRLSHYVRTPLNWT